MLLGGFRLNIVRFKTKLPVNCMAKKKHTNTPSWSKSGRGKKVLIGDRKCSVCIYLLNKNNPQWKPLYWKFGVWVVADKETMKPKHLFSFSTSLFFHMFSCLNLFIFIDMHSHFGGVLHTNLFWGKALYHMHI